MKLVYILILCATSAFAAKPKVNDSATSLTTDKHLLGNEVLESSSGQATTTVMQIDEGGDKISVRFGDAAGSHFDMTYPLSQFTQMFFFDSNEETCRVLAARGYKTSLEKVTVPAGTFDTCKYITVTTGLPGTETHTAWLSSQVPFGIVKDTSVKEDSGNTFVSESELNSFTN